MPTVAIKEPDAPATSRQTWLIKILGGGDVRDNGLTRQQASDKIVELQAAKGKIAPEVPAAKAEPVALSRRMGGTYATHRASMA
jgi:hypothetical protein